MNLFGLTQRNIKFILCLGGEVFDFQKFFQVELNTSVNKSGQKVYLHQFKNCEILQYLTKNIVKIFLEDKNH